ncbi:MAG: efflux RND transporter periplasmic adaptor subunit, partial [Planctomycetales bacterium]|nr:efflux RND transporter periplasmic adaptor subunit [Planctomycetales bacterium]
IEAYLEPYRQVDIGSGAEAGRITSVHVHKGDTVAKGQLLMELDSQILKASLDIAIRRSEMRGKLNAANAEMAIRRSRTDKLRALRTDGHATSGELERAETDLAISAATVLLAEEELSLFDLERQRIEAQIVNRQLRSPIEGVVVEIHREVGESALPSDQRILTVAQLSPLKVNLQIPFAHAAKLSKGEQLKLRVPTNTKDKTTVAVIELISSVADPASGTVEVQCTVDNSQHDFASGLKCVFDLKD